MFSFNRPFFLALGFLVPLYFFLGRVGFLKRMEIPLTLGDWNGLPVKWSSQTMRWVAFFSRLAAIAGFFCVVFAISQPVRYREERVYAGTGSGIVFALDISPSMAARDMGEGTRLDTARNFIHSFLDKRSGNSFGLVALGSEAALLVPPTTDHSVFLSRLDSLVIGELGDGTALGVGLAVAAAHLVNRERGKTCVILLTDGENNAGAINPKTAAGIFVDNDIALFIVGIGTKGQVSLEYTDPATGKEYSGMLDSDYDETELRSIAEKGGGTYVSAGSPDALSVIFSEIVEAIPINNSSWSRMIEDPLERPFVFAALALFAFFWILRRLVMGAIL